MALDAIPSLPADTISLRLLTEYLEADRKLMSFGDGTPADSEPEGSLHSNLVDRPKQRWVPRIQTLGEFDTRQLSSAHGSLIAAGWLHFQVEDRNAGLCYRVSPEGREALARGSQAVQQAQGPNCSMSPDFDSPASS